MHGREGKTLPHQAEMPFLETPIAFQMYLEVNFQQNFDPNDLVLIHSMQFFIMNLAKRFFNTLNEEHQ